MNKKLNRTKFIDTLNTIKKYEDLMSEFCNLLEKMSNNQGFCDAFIYSEYLETTISLLREFFEEYEMNIIEYFMFDLSFGKDYYDGCVLDKDKQIIDISTVEKLADYLQLVDDENEIK